MPAIYFYSWHLNLTNYLKLMKSIKFITVLLLCSLALSSCGVKGELYLPKKENTPVNVNYEG